MGHEQGYPVMCRLLNADVDIRNGVGPGGGRVVGWLPIVSLFGIEKLYSYDLLGSRR